MKRVNLIAVAVIVVCIGYYLLSLGTMLPSLTHVAKDFLEFIGSKSFLLDLRASLSRWTLGFAVGVTVGIVSGLVTGHRLRSKYISIGGTLAGIYNFLRAIPVIGLPVVLIFLAGFSEWGKVFIVAWGCIFPVWLSTSRGVRDRSKETEDVRRSLGLSRWVEFWRIEVPSISSAAFSGARIAVGVGWICIVAAEWIGVIEGGWFGHGLGLRLWAAQELNQLGLCVSILVIFGILGLVSDWFFVVFVRLCCVRFLLFDPVRGDIR